LGAVWRVNQNIAIRAAAGGGYALPQLSNLVGSNGAPTLCTCGTYYTVSTTNLNLNPEKSFGFDLGTDVRLHHDTVLAFDVYRVNLFGQFFQAAGVSGTYNGLPLYATEYENLPQSRYEGINLDIHHETPRGIYWHGALGLTRAYVVSVPPGFYDGTSGYPPALCTSCMNTYIIPGNNFDGAPESALSPIPYASGTAQIGYRWSAGTYIDLSPTYYGNGNPYFEPAFVEFDAHAGYALTKHVSLLATFRNISGIYGQNYQFYSPTPTLGAPTVAGQPYPLFGVPLGPRSVTITANFNF
jgi:outer membrane receptor protein involved in Fe transport